MRRLDSTFFALLIAFFAATSALAQQPAASDAGTGAAAPVMYVRDFQAVQEQGSSRGPLSRLRSATHARSADQNAAALAGAIVKQLTGAGLTARYLGPGEPVPASGWLIGGMYYSRDPGGRIQSLLSSASGNGGGDNNNVEVSVTIADAAGNPNVPFAAIGSEDAIRGQGTVASWNPYIVAAKFVIKKVEGTTGVDSLAKDIAAQIVGNLPALQQKDEAVQPH